MGCRTQWGDHRDTEQRDRDSSWVGGERAPLLPRSRAREGQESSLVWGEGSGTPLLGGEAHQARVWQW